ncbi:MAG TPA: CvpA family protein [Candidatus Tetragenococcus pullicola]|nr:CvpA family protein [Candidatus Tetragenococcus pullicola]
MIGFIIFLCLLLAFYAGGRRGAAYQLVYTIGMAISFFIATKYYQFWGGKIELYVPYLSVNPETKMHYYDQATSFDLDKAYYAAVAFIGLLFIGWLVTKLIGIFAVDLRFVKLFSYDWLLAGLLNVMLVYVALVMIFFIFSLIPLDIIQSIFDRSTMVRFMIEKTPFFSKQIYKLWISTVI